MYLCVAPVDGRKQAASLALLVEQSLGRKVFEPALYVFCNRKRDRVRIVYWERNRLCLWSKRVAAAVHLAACRIGRHRGDERTGSRARRRALR